MLIMKEIRAFKLVRLLKDGQFAPLFINRRLRLPVGVWLEAEDHPTKGYAHRPGWHCTLSPTAPHLSLSRRVWLKVALKDFKYIDRPESQGGRWALANWMKVLGIAELPQGGA